MTGEAFKGTGDRLTDAGITKAAAKIGCEEDALLAVLSVETGGRGFDASGRVKALFEPHRFYALLSGSKRAAAVKAGLAYPKWGTKPYPKDSFARIDAASKIDPEAAMQATSWGLGQIMGSNFKAAGFPSARAMVEAFKTGEDLQLLGMAVFIVASGLAGALKRKDWKAFAKGYNGPGYATNRYDAKLAAAYAKRVQPMARGLLSVPEDEEPAEDEDAANVDPGADSTSGADAVDIAFDNPTTEPDPPADPVLAREEVKALQLRLQALNYAMVGKADGAYGASTVAAVAAFQHEHELPVTGRLDEATRAAVWQEQEPREIPDARAQASTKEVAARVPAVQANWLSKIGAAVLAAGASAASFVQGIVSNIPGASDTLSGVRSFFGDVPGWAYGGIVAAVAGFIWWKSRQSEKEAVKDFRTGRTS